MLTCKNSAYFSYTHYITRNSCQKINTITHQKYLPVAEERETFEQLLHSR